MDLCSQRGSEKRKKKRKSKSTPSKEAVISSEDCTNEQKASDDGIPSSLPSTACTAVTTTTHLSAADQITVLDPGTGESTTVCDTEPPSAVSSTASNSKRKKKKGSRQSAGSSDSSTKSKSTVTDNPIVDEVPHSLVESPVQAASVSSFAQELEWCIAQLEVGILRSDATKTQKQENKKYIRCLRSEKTALPRKRQLMKSLFGDYRSKIAREPVFPAPLPSMSHTRDKSVESKGKFFRKATSTPHKDSEGIEVDSASLKRECVSREGTELNEPGMFRFNFNVES